MHLAREWQGRWMAYAGGVLFLCIGANSCLSEAAIEFVFIVQSAHSKLHVVPTFIRFVLYSVAFCELM